MNFISKIEEELNKYPLKEIRAAYEEMSHFYRKDRDHIHFSLDSSQKRLAYIAARMPATYAAVRDVMLELNKNEGAHSCESLLDIGAGCGTASFAACEVLENLNKLTAIEQNSEMVKIGKQFAVQHPVLKNAEWISANMLAPTIEFPASDIVVLSYSLNEIPADKQEQLILKLWSITNKYLVIIEPGTKASFNLIHSIRNLFIQHGHSILSPCPHARSCPAYASDDLCHFSTRVQRTSFHRYLKQGELSFEDEKYSYLILSKLQKENYEARVVRDPVKRSGFISLKLCTESGFLTKSWSKKDREQYNQFKDSQWGDKF